MAAGAEIRLRRRSKVELEVQICEISLISNLAPMGMGAWMGPSTNEKEGSMHHDTQLHIASQLLSALMFQTPSRDMDDREADIRHALDVAAELMRQWGPTTPPQLRGHLLYRLGGPDGRDAGPGLGTSGTLRTDGATNAGNSPQD